MKTVRMLTRVLLFVVVLSGVPTTSAADRSSEKTAQYMRAKLVHTQKILEALALEDFDQLAKSSQALKLLSQESNWNVFETEQYLQHSGDFRRRADALTEAAKRKNIDGASLAFVELTLNCVQCHKYVRDVRMDKIEPDAEPAPSATKPKTK